MDREFEPVNINIAHIRRIWIEMGELFMKMHLEK